MSENRGEIQLYNKPVRKSRRERFKELRAIQKALVEHSFKTLQSIHGLYRSVNPVEINFNSLYPSLAQHQEENQEGQQMEKEQMQKEQRKREKRREKKRKMRERRREKKRKMDILDNDITRTSFALDFSALYCNYGLCFFSTPINRKSFIFTDAKGDLKCWRFSDEEKVEIPNDD